MRCRDVKLAMQESMPGRAACEAEMPAKQRCMRCREACDAYRDVEHAMRRSMRCREACDAEKHAMPTCMRNRDAGDAEKHAMQRCAACYAEKHAMKRSMRRQVALKACIICIQMHMIHVRCT
jgi:hypothetical protein